MLRERRPDMCVSPIAVAGVEGVQRGSQERTKTCETSNLPATFLQPFLRRGDNYVRELGRAARATLRAFSSSVGLSPLPLLHAAVWNIPHRVVSRVRSKVFPVMGV